ncbi:MAG: PDZ domain-containing protein, partial [Actinomycetota bacterium]
GTQASFRGPRGRRIPGSVEHTAPLLPGSSGGPVVDASGKLVGINTHRLGEGFYLAIPADDALRDRATALARGETPSRMKLGVAIASSDVTRRLRRATGLPEIDGLLVRAVEDDTAAANAGIKQGDVLVEAGGRALRNADDLFLALDTVTDTLQLKIVRGTEALTVNVGF